MSGEKKQITNEDVNNALDEAANLLEKVSSSFVVLAMADNEDASHGARVKGDIDELLALHGRFGAAIYNRSLEFQDLAPKIKGKRPEQVHDPGVA